MHGHSDICPTLNCRPRIESAGGLDSKAFGCIDGKYVCLLCLFASFSGAAPVFGRSPKIRSKKAAATTPWANCNSFASPVPCCGGRMFHDVVTHFFVVMQKLMSLESMEWFASDNGWRYEIKKNLKDRISRNC